MYNKRQFNKQNDKKILHKVKKQWIVVSLALLAAIGTSSVLAVKSHADVTDPNNSLKNQKGTADPQVNATLVHQPTIQQNHNYAQQPVSTTTITHQADHLYTHMVSNAMLNASSNGRLGRSPQQSLPQIPQHDGTWGNALYTFDHNTGHLEVIGNPITTIQNEANNGGIDTISPVRILNKNLSYQSSAASNQYRSEMNNYNTASDLHHNVNPTEIRSISFHDDLVQLPEDSSYLFAGLPNLTSVDLTGIHANQPTSDITSLNHMFADDPELRTVNLGDNFITSDVHDMSSMFSDDPLLTTIDFGMTFTTKHAKDLSNMFNDDKSLRHLDLSHFNTDHVENMNHMLKGLTSLQSITLGLKTKLNHSADLTDTWYEKDVGDDYTASEPDNLTSGQTMPGTYLDHQNIYPTSGNSSVTGYLYTAPYAFDKRTGVLQITGNGTIQSLDALQGDINLNDVKEIKVTGYNNTITSDAAADFDNLPHLETIDLSGLNTTGMVNTASMFQNDPELKEIDFGNHFDTSHVTNMSDMFEGDPSLRTIDLSHFNTTRVTDMSSMFRSDHGIKDLNLVSFNTSNVTNMRQMFYDDSLLSDVKFGDQFNTSNVTDMSYMFNEDPQLIDLDLSGFNTSHVTNMDSMFQSDDNLSSLKLGPSFKTTNVSDMDHMFFNDHNLESLDLSTFDTRKAFHAGDMQAMFYKLAKLSKLRLSSDVMIPSSANLSDQVWYQCEPNSNYTTDRSTHLISNHSINAGTYVLTPNIASDQKNRWNLTGKWGSAQFKFNPVTGLLQTTSSGTISSLSQLFKNNPSDLGKIKKITFAPGTKAPKDSSNLFAGIQIPEDTPEGMIESVSSLANLKDIDCRNLDTSNVTSMNSMFYNDTGLTTLNLTGFRTNRVSGETSKRVTNNGTSKTMKYEYNGGMSNMFENDYSLTSLDLSSFDTSQVRGMNDMFYNDYALNSLILGDHFNTARVVFMDGMFDGDHSLTSLDLKGQFDTGMLASVGGSMSDMFSNDYSLKLLALGPHFNTNGVKNMANMFRNDFAFSDLDLGNQFDTSKVTNMDRMFASDDDLQSLTLGDHFTTQFAQNNKHANDLFSSDSALATIKGDHFELTSDVALPISFTQGWYLQDQAGKPVGENVDLIDGVPHSGTFGRYTSARSVQTTLQFMDGKQKIGKVNLTGYENTPILYGVIANELSKYYKNYYLNIPTKELALSIPNSPYQYLQATINVPVKQDNESSVAVTPSSLTVQGNIHLNFYDYHNDKVKSLTIPYHINKVPVGSTIGNILSEGDPSVTTPGEYLGKTIQSFPIQGYLYENNGSQPNDYLNVSVSDNGVKEKHVVTHDLTFNFKSKGVDEHVTYMYGSTPEGSTDIFGMPGRSGNDDQLTDLAHGFELTPHTKTSFMFSRNGKVTIQVQPVKMLVPYRIIDASDPSSVLYNSQTSNQLTVTKPQVLMSDQAQDQINAKLRKQGYVLDGNNNYRFTVMPSDVDQNNHFESDQVPVLKADLLKFTVPVEYRYGNGTKKVNITQTVKSDLTKAVKNHLPSGYQLVSDQKLSKWKLLDNVKPDNNQTKPLVINVKPQQLRAIVNYVYKGKTINNQPVVIGSGDASETGLNDSYFKISSNLKGLPAGYQLNDPNQIVYYNGHVQAVNITPKQVRDKISYVYQDQKGYQHLEGAFEKQGDDAATQLPSSSFEVGNDRTNLHYGFKVINPSQVIPFDGQQDHKILVSPNQAKITINYVANGHLVGTHQFIGDEGATGLSDDHFKLGDHPVGLWNGYYVADPDQVIYYNDTTKDVPVKAGSFKIPFKIVSADDHADVLMNGKSTNFVTVDTAGKLTLPMDMISKDLKSQEYQLSKHLDLNFKLSHNDVTNSDRLSLAHEPTLIAFATGVRLPVHYVNEENKDVGHDYVIDNVKPNQNNNIDHAVTAHVPDGYQLTSHYSKADLSKYTFKPAAVKADKTLMPLVIQVQPVQATDVITYNDNGTNVTSDTSTDQATGNEFVGNTHFDLAELTLPKGYRLSPGNRPEIPYDGKHHVINVQKIAEPSKTHQSGPSVNRPLLPAVSQSMVLPRSMNNETPVDQKTSQPVLTDVLNNQIVTDKGFAIHHDASDNHDVVMYHGQSHTVHYNNNGKQTIQVKFNGHYYNVIIGTDLPTNNVPSKLIRAVSVVDFDKPAKHVWSLKHLNNLLNRIKPGKVISCYGTKYVQIRIPYYDRYFTINKNALAHVSITKVGNGSDKHAIKLRKNTAFKIMKIVIVHRRHHNYARYEIRIHAHNYWITARQDYLQSTYFKPTDIKSHHDQVRLIHKCRIYSKSQSDEPRIVKTLKVGTHLRIKKVRSVNGKTELLLSNGDYITADKRYVKLMK